MEHYSRSIVEVVVCCRSSHARCEKVIIIFIIGDSGVYGKRVGKVIVSGVGVEAVHYPCMSRLLFLLKMLHSSSVCRIEVSMQLLGQKECRVVV